MVFNILEEIMTKKAMFLFFVLVCANGFSQINIPNFGWHAGGGTPDYIVGHNNKLYSVDAESEGMNRAFGSNREWYRDITSNLYLDNNGFLRMAYLGERSPSEDGYFIFSPKYFIVSQNDDTFFWEEEYTKRGELQFSNLFIKSIKSNDYLIENGVHYSPQGFLKKFWDQSNKVEEHPTLEYYNRTPPFAIGAAKIKNLVIDIEFETEAAGMMLLNGFVDLRKPHLYKDNARIKEFVIVIDGKEKQYTLNDEIRFQEIEFTKPAKKISMKIVSYYPGAKYQDVCLSSICPVFNPNTKEYESLNRFNKYSSYGSRIK